MDTYSHHTQKKLALYHHLGLGDHIICNGLVREYAKQWQVSLFSKHHNFPAVALMYRDLPNVKVIAVSGDKQAERMLFWKQFFMKTKKVGFKDLDAKSGISFDEQFYRLAGLDISKKWRNFYVKRDLEKEAAIFSKHVPLLSPTDNYIFLHDDKSRGYEIDLSKITSKDRMVRPEKTFTDNIFDYCSLLEKAKEIHVIDSSFLSLVDCLEYTTPGQKLFLHAYAKGTSGWLLPKLKKNWQIIT